MTSALHVAATLVEEFAPTCGVIGHARYFLPESNDRDADHRPLRASSFLFKPFASIPDMVLQ